MNQKAPTNFLTFGSEPEREDMRRVVEAIRRVAVAFALPVTEQMIGIARILLERYDVETITEASRLMPFDVELADKLRYTRGLAVTDFSSQVERAKHRTNEYQPPHGPDAQTPKAAADAIAGYLTGT